MFFLDHGGAIFSTSESGINATSASLFNVWVARVTSIKDDTLGGIIYASIPNVDNKNIADDDDTLMAFPLMTKFIHVLPKKDEYVFIFIQDNKQTSGNRFWMGPIISQPQFLKSDTFNALSELKAGRVGNPSKAPNDADTIGSFPSVTDIAIQGRDNSDIILRPNAVVIRAGKFEFDVPKETQIPNFNKINPAYVKLNYHVPIKQENNITTYGSSIAMVADKLMLLTHSGKKSNLKTIKLTNPNEEMPIETILEILAHAESAVYGDTLVRFIKEILIPYLTEHTHNGSGNPPIVTLQLSQKLELFNYNDLLADNIRMI